MKKKILLVEDDALTTSIVNYILQKNNYEVAICKDGYIGIDMMEEFKPDLLITDLMLPGISGMEVLHYSKNKYPDLPVIIMSVFANQTDLLDKVLRAKADNIISKKFKPNEILDVIKKTIK